MNRMMALALPLTVFLFASAPATAQFVRFQVQTQTLSSVVEPEALDFQDSDSTSTSFELNSSGEVSALLASACLRIGAVENIPLIVDVRIEDLRLSDGQERPIDLEPRYINDTNPCPADIVLVREVSRPFRADGTVEFRLSEQPETLSSSTRRATSLTAFIVLLGRQHLRLDDAIMDRRLDLDYRGRYLLDITYL